MDGRRDGLAVRTLGAPGLAWRGVALEVSLTKPAAVAYVLALRGAPVPKSELMELLWGTGRGANLRTALYALRKHAHADAWLHETPDGRALTVDGTVDLEAFERAMAAGDVGAALAVLPDGSADGIVPRLLDGFEVPAAPAFEEWLEAERARVDALMRECLSTHARRLAAAGAHDEARGRLKGVLAADPYDEASHRALMEVLAVRGDVEGALRQYEACRRLLADELGVAPVAETTETYERIRTGRRPAAPVASTHAEQRGHAVEFVGRERELAELDGALGLSAERLLPLRGMTTAGDDGGAPSGVSDAARLFVTAVRPIDSEVDPDSAVTRAIVETLRGHPLAIVLAAGWLRFQDGRGLLRTLRDDLLALENRGWTSRAATPACAG